MESTLREMILLPSALTFLPTMTVVQARAETDVARAKDDATRAAAISLERVFTMPPPASSDGQQQIVEATDIAVVHVLHDSLRHLDADIRGDVIV